MCMTQNAIVVENLQKTYAGGKQALRGVSLEIPRGSMFALLGPNGAGKSTLINILAGLVNKTGGAASIWGFDIDRDIRNAKACIGIVPQELVFDAFFTPREVLELQAGMYGIAKADRQTDALLAAVHLTDKADAYARTLSGGMKRRLLIAKAMVHRPPILILDEPTAGVDLELRQQLWDYVRRLHAEGTTIVLTTHYLEEAEELCDRIAIIHNGEVVANTDKQSLMAQARDKVLVVTLDQDVQEPPPCLSDYAVSARGPRTLAITYDKQQANAGLILGALARGGINVVDVSTQEADLEDIFLNLTYRAQAPATGAAA